MRKASPVVTYGLVAILLLTACFSIQTPAQNGSRTNGVKPKAPALAVEPADSKDSEMRPVIERYSVDRGTLARSWPVAASPTRRDRFKKFYADTLAGLQKLNFDAMSQDGKIDCILFKNNLEYEIRQLDIREKQLAEIQPLMPFAKTIIDMEEARRRMEPIDSAKVAAALTSLRKQVDETRRAVELGLRPDRGGETASSDALRVKRTVANRGVQALTTLRGTLRNWYSFYNGYDPMFTWWNEEPYRALDQSLTTYTSFLTERVVGLRTEGAAQTQTAGGGRGPGGGGPVGGATGQGQGRGQ